jgi:hypothetical protein
MSPAAVSGVRPMSRLGLVDQLEPGVVDGQEGTQEEFGFEEKEEIRDGAEKTKSRDQEKIRGTQEGGAAG